MRWERGCVICAVTVVTAGFASDETGGRLSPELLFRRTVAAWQSSPNNWNVWEELANLLWDQALETTESSFRLETIGALEEAILVSEYFSLHFLLILFYPVLILIH